MNERVQRYFLWLVALLLVGGTALALRYVRGYRPVAAGLAFSAPPPLPGDIALRFNNVRAVGRRDNRPAWILTAKQIDTTRSRSRVDFSGGVEATLLSGEKPRARFNAPQASYDVGARTLVAAGQLVCRVFPKNGRTSPSADDLRIEANQVVWSVGSESVTCPGPVHAYLSGMTVGGDDLLVNLRTREHSLKHIQGTVTLTDEGVPELPAATALKGLVP